MTPRRFLFLLALAALAAVNCGRTGPATGMTFTGTALPDGEICEYRLLMAGQVNGAMATMVQRVQFGDVPAYRFDIIARTRNGAVETTDSSAIFVGRDSMTPLTAFRFIRTGGELVTTAANYADSSVAISTYAQGKEKQQLLPFGPRTYDADQLVALGRSIQVSGRRPVEISVVSPIGPPLGGSVMPGKIASGGSETVRVPAGVFDCYKMVYAVGQQIVTVWYEKAGARRMVKYDAGSGEQVMELVSTRP
jgi:hypothetical protein